MTKLDLLITAIVAIIIFICFFLFVPPVSEIHQLREELLQEQQHHQNLESEVVEYERQIDKIKRTLGFDICIVTTATSDDAGDRIERQRRRVARGFDAGGTGRGAVPGEPPRLRDIPADNRA